MNKILNYISGGKGIGAVLILLLSALISVYFSLMARTAVINSIPYLQMIADEILPISMVDGTITVPQNTKKVYPIYSDEKSEDVSFTIDTTSDSLDTTNLKSGLYLTLSYFYAVDNSKGEIKSTKLKGSIRLDKKDYTNILKDNVKWIVMAIFTLSMISYFIVYFLLTMFYAFCAGIAAKVSNKNLDFDKKMRLSAVCLFIVLILSFVSGLFNINIPWLMFLLLVIGLQIFFTKKLP